MTTYKILASDSASAMEEVVKKLGPDALIVSTSKRGNKVEIEATNSFSRQQKQKDIISSGGSVGGSLSGTDTSVPTPEGAGHLQWVLSSNDESAGNPYDDNANDDGDCKIMKNGEDQDQSQEESTHDVLNAFDFDSIMIPKRSNMKAEIIGLPSEVGDFTNSYCIELCRYIDNPKSIDFLRLRDILYDMLIYDIKVNNVLWTILCYVTHKYPLCEEAYDKLMIDMYTFLQYYNNNYRPIYHLESYLLKIINTVHYPLDLLEAKEG